MISVKGNTIPALEAKDLVVELGGQKVLDAATLQVQPNEVLIIMGPNGSGKTTLLLCLALLLKPASGTISYNAVPVLDSRRTLELRRRLAVVFQEPLLLNSTVWDNVTLGLRLRSMKSDEARIRAQRWLERFGVSHLAKRQARMLSGGESKRVSLARAFALQPDVLFLDEPFASLDSPTRLSLMEDFESVLRETKVTTVMVTHEHSEAIALAHRILVLMNGQVRQIGTPEEIFSRPVDEEVAGFVECENIINGIVTSKEDGLVGIDVGSDIIEAVSDCRIGDRVSICIRPEDITLAKAKTSSSARNSFAGEVTRLTLLGTLIRVEIDCGFPLVVLITKRSADEMLLERGSKIFASFKATAIHVIRRGTQY